ncbi:LacI family transcriptional regulator [Mycoplasmopsis equigenitalium]|uniref:LacI family transcriptional regulator n=1 Tax=Mycoplasmopsis equigenitalium TaxID=114883 RepID=A0ABY5J1D7_9BACT|nr:LacI family DNA-binding transcriptional regulator [Mycoplasmopsis equigenitalium]UUD37063.1 LacI family transcriptional regulator [Mycoplasmopsis equigenitalium]
MLNLTYKDIAKKAGVSVSTISRYYNNGYVSRANKAKIKAVVDQYDFVPNSGARLIRGQTNIIYVILPDFAEDIFSDIVGGIEAEASLKGKHVFVTHAKANTESFIQKTKYINSWKPGSIVLFLPYYDEKIDAFLKEHQDMNIVVYGFETNHAKFAKYDDKDMFYKLVKTYYHSRPVKKLLFLKSEKLTEKQNVDWSKSFKKAIIEYDIDGLEYTLNNHRDADVNEFLAYVKSNNIYDIVCSTHETFVNLLAKADTTFNLNLTDIGYESIYDYNKKYRNKIFIDYHLLGVMITKLTEASKDIQPVVIPASVI